MLGHKLVTKQTGPEGTLVSKVMIAQSIDLNRETYFAILMDRAYSGPVMVASPKGGMDIEQVAEESPELIFKAFLFYFCLSIRRFLLTHVTSPSRSPSISTKESSPSKPGDWLSRWDSRERKRSPMYDAAPSGLMTHIFAAY